VGVAGSLAVGVIGNHHLPWETCVHYIGLMMLGMLASQISLSGVEKWRRIRQSVPWGWIAALSAAVVVVFVTLFFRPIIAFAAPLYFADLLVGMMSALILIELSAHPETAFGRFAQWRPLGFVGVMSYSMYLIHGPLLVWARMTLPAALTWKVGATMWFAVFPVIGAVSYGFYLLFEKPIGKRRK